MPAKKKTSKKIRTKKIVAAAPVESAPSQPALSAAPNRRFWVPLAVGLVLLSILVVVMLNRRADTVAPAQPSSNSGAPSTLRVTAGQEGGTSSNGVANALQPQSAGLQQARPTQPAGVPTLQAQPAPNP